MLRMVNARSAAAAFLAAAAGCVGSGARPFIVMNASSAAITHVRVIDGTGSPAQDNQTVVIQAGRIREVGDAGTVKVPPGATSIDGRGRTVIPGLVGMHEHLFYQTDTADGVRAYPAQASFAKLYLASGVTTIRTAGTVDLDGDLRIKEQIDAGRVPGPKIHVTSLYLNPGSVQPDPDAIAREVDREANRGVTSFKAYTSIRSSELQAAIGAAHARRLRVTGHLCAVGFREAAALGIDNVEHGIVVDTELYSGKQPDVCPSQSVVLGELAARDVLTDAEIGGVIRDLVRHGVAVTSTLAVFESFTGQPSAFDPRMPVVLAPRLRAVYDATLPRWSDPSSGEGRFWSSVLRKEMQFERRFLAADGLLMAGVDPTGWGGIVAGFGDQRELELLVEAGLTPEAAIRVATVNGADFLYASDRIGSIARGLAADLVLVRGNPSARISDVRNVEMVFKDGVGYDPDALIASVQGTVGRLELRQILRWPYNAILFALVALLVLRIWSNARRRRLMEPAAY